MNLRSLSMTKGELKDLLVRANFHATEAAQAARRATLESINGRRTPAEESEIQKNVATANCRAVEANLLFLRCVVLSEGLEATPDE